MFKSNNKLTSTDSSLFASNQNFDEDDSKEDNESGKDKD